MHVVVASIRLHMDRPSRGRTVQSKPQVKTTLNPTQFPCGLLPSTMSRKAGLPLPTLAVAAARYLQAEREAVNNEIDILTSYGPFKKVEIEEQQ